jgi:S1-C subfamily serine protease
MVTEHEGSVKQAEAVFQSVAESVVLIEHPNGGSGTGFVTLTASGKPVIVTNDHVCDSDSQAPIFLISHRSGNSLRTSSHHTSFILHRDDAHDLCMIALPPDMEVEPLKLADDVYVDERVHIIGYPAVPLLSSAVGYIRGLRLINHAYNIPIASCVGKKFVVETVPIKTQNGEIENRPVCFLRAAFFFTDALGEFGASGSPSLNNKGEVIGVMSMIAGQARPFAHIVPLQNLKEFLNKH